MTHHPDNAIERNLPRALTVATEPIEMRLSALEHHGIEPQETDWRRVFYQLSALRPSDELDEWWNDVIINTMAFVLAPIVKRLEALERGEAASR